MTYTVHIWMQRGGEPITIPCATLQQAEATFARYDALRKPRARRVILVHEGQKIKSKRGRR